MKNHCNVFGEITALLFSILQIIKHRQNIKSQRIVIINTGWGDYIYGNNRKLYITAIPKSLSTDNRYIKTYRICL